MNKKSFILGAALSAVLFFAACGDDSSSTSANNEPSEDVTLSSSDKAQSSSSEKAASSSSKDVEPAETSSSSEKKSAGDEKSSSSEKAAEPESSSDKASGDGAKSSSSEKSEESSSSVEDAVSSSSEAVSSSSDIPMSIAEAKVMPSGTYNCKKYNCFTTEYLNQELLEAGKYGEILDERDNHVYKTTTIGDQIWMAENLNYADSNETPSLKGKSWCYNDSAEYCDKYGRLYTWAAAIDSVRLAPLDCGYMKNCGRLGTVQGICPSGWHLPSYEELCVLFSVVERDYEAGLGLKSKTGGWHDSYDGEDRNGVDAFGFSALPAGFYDSDDGYSDREFSGEGVQTNFWSSSKSTDYDAYYLWVPEVDYADLMHHFKRNGYSVRCLKDAE